MFRRREKTLFVPEEIIRSYTIKKKKKKGKTTFSPNTQQESEKKHTMRSRSKNTPTVNLKI